MKIIGILLAAVIIFSYLPVVSMDGCPEGHHMGNVKVDCGYCLHCPILFGRSIQDFSPLPFSEEWVSASFLHKVDGLISSIFRPPELAFKNG